MRVFTEKGGKDGWQDVRESAAARLHAARSNGKTIRLPNARLLRLTVAVDYSIRGTAAHTAQQGHGKAVDWWALGVLTYEMVAGYPPFYDDDPMKTYKKIILGKYDFPKHFSPNLKDFVRQLLQVCILIAYLCILLRSTLAGYYRLRAICYRAIVFTL